MTDQATAQHGKSHYTPLYDFEMSQLRQYLEALKQQGGVTKSNYALVVITLMTLVGMDRIQGFIEDMANLQKWVTQNQAFAAEAEAFINSLLGAVVAYSKEHPGPDGQTTGGGLPKGYYPTPGQKPTAAQKQHEQQLKQFMQKLFGMFGGGADGGEKWKDLGVQTKNGWVPLYKDGKINPAFKQFMDGLQKYMGAGTTVPGSPSNALAPLFDVLAVAELQKAIDDGDAVYNSDGTINLQKTFGAYSSHSGLSGLEGIFAALNKEVPDSGGKTHNLWDLMQGALEGNTQDMELLEQCMMTMGANYYKSHYATSGEPGGSSILQNLVSACGMAGTLLQTATQTNTAEMQQDIQTLTSFDKIGQSIVTSSSKGVDTMVQNQKPA